MRPPSAGLGLVSVSPWLVLPDLSFAVREHPQLPGTPSLPGAPLGTTADLEKTANAGLHLSPRAGTGTDGEAVTGGLKCT